MEVIGMYSPVHELFSLFNNSDSRNKEFNAFLAEYRVESSAVFATLVNGGSSITTNDRSVKHTEWNTESIAVSTNQVCAYHDSCHW